MRVTLEDHTADPIATLYVAFRTAYSSNPPERIWRLTRKERISRERMEAFINARLDTGHTSPLEQVSFTFSISGISRALSHQFVRTRVGMSPEQQSQRYVIFSEASWFDFVTPPTIITADLERAYDDLMDQVGAFYSRAVAAGVPAEDARFVLPNATTTNISCTVNLAALLHMGDLRLCTRAQWEYRQLVGKMRAAVNEKFPILGRRMGIICQPMRAGYCPESLADYENCPVAKGHNPPPHKTHLIQLRQQLAKTREPARVE